MQMLGKVNVIIKDMALLQLNKKNIPQNPYNTTNEFKIMQQSTINFI